MPSKFRTRVLPKKDPAASKASPKPASPKKPRKSFGPSQKTFRPWRTKAVIGIAFLILFFGISIVASYIRAVENREELLKRGKWDPLISSEDANRVFESGKEDLPNGKARYVLKEKKGRMDQYVPDKHTQNYIRYHVKHFESQQRFHHGDNTARGEAQNIFEVVADEETGAPKYVRIKDLSSFNRAPSSARQYKYLGDIFFAPNKQLTYVLTNGFVNLYLNPSSHFIVSHHIDAPGHAVGREIILEDKGPVARLAIDQAAQAIKITGIGDMPVSLENNKCYTGVSPLDGQIVEIDGRFFEAGIKDDLAVASTTENSGEPQRLYPFGDLLHIVGPASLDRSFQSLGIEYMFQEYLMGDAEENISPGKIWLTLEKPLQVALRQAVDELAKKSAVFSGAKGRDVCSAMIMNAKTGAVLAMAGGRKAYDELYNPADVPEIVDMLKRGADRYANHACFKRHVIGSVTKPFIAFAALNLIPEVENMIVDGSGKTFTIFGHRMYTQRQERGGSELDLYSPGIDFDRYIIGSKNAYHHTLGLLLMAGVKDIRGQVSAPWLGKAPRNSRFTDARFIHLWPALKRGDQFLEVGTLGEKGANRVDIDSDFSDFLRDAYDLGTSDSGQTADDRDISIYGEQFVEFAKEILWKKQPGLRNPEQILLARSAVCAPETTRMETDSIVLTVQAKNFLFGGKGNKWTNAKICEIFSRIVTEKNVEARIVHSFLDTLENKTVVLEKDVAKSLKTAMGEKSSRFTVKDESFAKMRSLLKQVPTVEAGTADHVLKDTVATLARSNPGFVLFGKTGTLREEKGWPNSKLFMGCCGVWDESARQFRGPAFTFVVYLKASRDDDNVLYFVRDNIEKWWRMLNPATI